MVVYFAWVHLKSTLVDRDQKRFKHRRWTQHAMYPGQAGSRLWYRTDCVVGGVRSHVPARPAARQSFSCKWGAAGWGESMYLCLTGVLLWLPRRPPWTVCIHFHDSYPVDISHPLTSVSSFSVCCCSRHLSLWPGPCWCWMSNTIMDGWEHKKM